MNYSYVVTYGDELVVTGANMKSIIEYLSDFCADNSYFDSFADDVVSESYEVLDGPIASISSSARATGASSGTKIASAVAGKSSTASSTTSHIIKGVETATDLVSFNKKTAAAAAGLGLAGGYFANRKRTRR